MNAGFVAWVQLRWTDLDAQGHVNNVVVAEYLQQARAEFMLSGKASEMLDEGVVVVGHQISYRSPIHFSDDPLRAEVWVAAARDASGVELMASADQVAQGQLL